jgi:hypothetical protein
MKWRMASIAIFAATMIAQVTSPKFESATIKATQELEGGSR